ncbi:peptidoglycan-binding domain-containing protein [Amaricoccus sp.]|uniref:peptidoglycan-binding domain-containing protein n=1 Tax=Amaricoccus sp. TaxID=1872485 RepID=UPI001B58345D|nr:peptidoglycan-binding domain-containing protein [Amaricoccus sp.]MBP7242009.1 peptidoglycan-binding protein [Amaricoccus sp.]
MRRNGGGCKPGQRLHKLGFNPGDVDGVRGRQTINAIKRFQESKGLVADGVVGRATCGSTIRAGRR